MRLPRWLRPGHAPTDAPDPARADPGVVPLPIPGYGSPPVTRGYDDGPEPAAYGIPSPSGPPDQGRDSPAERS